MFKRLAKICLGCLWLLYWLPLLAVVRVRKSAFRSVLIVLYYHAVPARAAARFSRQMWILHRLGIAASPLELTADRRRNGIRVLVTFDDGFESVIEHALPHLRQFGIPAIVFVPSGYIGRAPGWVPEHSPLRQERVMNEQQLCLLARDPLITIGSHCRSHRKLTGLSQETAELEIRESKREIESILGTPVIWISFPHGACNSSHAAITREAGYSRVFTIQPHLLKGLREEYAVGRFPVSAESWWIEYLLTISGGCGWRSLGARLRRFVQAGAQRSEPDGDVPIAGASS